MSNATSSEPDPALTPPNVPKVPWNPWLGVIFVVFVFLGSQIISSLLISIYPAQMHWTGQQANDWLGNSIYAQFFYILITGLLSIGAIYLFLRRRKLSMSIIGLRRPRWSDPIYGLAAVVPYFVFYLLTVGIVSHLVPSLNVNEQQQLGFDNVQGGGALLLTFISLVIFPPIVEEIMVRGFLYSSFKKAMPMIWAALVTSLIFAAAHLPEGGAAGPLYIAALDTFVLSLVLVYLREKTGGLYASMTLHAIKNGIAFLALFVFHLS